MSVYKRTFEVDGSVTCVDVREARLRGAPLSREASEHALSCPVCSADAVAGGAPDEALDELFRGIETKLTHERGMVAWLRSRATPVRLFLAVAWIAALAALSALGMPRTRYAPVPVERVVLVFSSLALLSAMLLRMGLRPTQAPAPSDRSILAGLAAGLLFPVVAAFLPAGPHPFDHYTQYTQAQATIGCFVIGAVTAALVVAMLRMLDRSAHDSRLAALLAAVSGSVAGNLALELHCPVTAPAHLLMGHATVGLALVLAYGIVRRPAHP
jgi:hypothetical protein